MAIGTAEFVVKARDEASAALARITGATTDLRGAFNSLASKAGVFGLIATGAAAAVGGIVAAGKAMADTVETLDRTAVRTGVSIERLQAIQEVVRQGGGDVDAVTAALGFLNRAIATQEPLLGKLGITTHDTYAAFTQLAGVLSRSSDAAARTEVAFKLMGRGAGEIIGLLGEVATQSDAMQQSLRESGGLISGQTAESARKLDKQLDALGQTWRSLTTSFQALAVPIATVVVGMFDALLKATLAFGQSVRDGAIGPLEELAKTAREVGSITPQSEPADATGSHTVVVRKPAPGMVPPQGNVPGGPVAVAVPPPNLYEVEVTAKRPVDPLKKLDLTGDSPEKSAAEARKKRLEEIQRLLEVGRVQAERYLEALERLERTSKHTKLVEQLREEGVDVIAPETRKREQQAGPVPEVQPRGVGTRRSERHVADQQRAEQVFKPEEAEKKIAHLTESASKLNAVWALVGTGWLNTVQQMTSATAVLDQSMAAVFDGLQSGFAQVFSNLTNKAQTLRGAMRTIFASLVQEILAMLARLAAAKVFELILSLIPGLGPIARGAQFASNAITTGTLTNGGPGGAPQIPGDVPGGNSLRERPRVTVNISALNSRNMREELTNPGGQLREALEQAGLVGAF